MIRELCTALTDIKSMFVGLKITSTNFFKPTVTVHYPRQTVDTLEGYRGHVELLALDDDPLTPRCVSCGTCAQMCPSGCITVRMDPSGRPDPVSLPAHPALAGLRLEMRQKFVHPVDMVRRPSSFLLDYNYCSLCGLCVLNCPSGALRFSRNVYLASENAADFKFDLLARMRSQSGAGEER